MWEDGVFLFNSPYKPLIAHLIGNVVANFSDAFQPLLPLVYKTLDPVGGPVLMFSLLSTGKWKQNAQKKNIHKWRAYNVSFRNE